VQARDANSEHDQTLQTTLANNVGQTWQAWLAAFRHSGIPFKIKMSSIVKLTALT
jgi:hypothetical protein